MSIYNFQNVVDQSVYCLIDLTFWLITSLIFNRFSIRKKFWKAETQGFPTIVSTVCHVKSMGASMLRLVILADYCPLDAFFHSNHGKLFRLITSLIFNRFSIRKKFWKAETQGFPTIVSTVCHVKSMGASMAGDSG